MDKNNWEELNQKMMKNGWSEQAVFEIQDYLNEAYQKGKEEERKAMYSDECLIIKKETRQETLEEVEKKIEKLDRDTPHNISILDILQQLHKMKEK